MGGKTLFTFWQKYDLKPKPHPTHAGLGHKRVGRENTHGTRGAIQFIFWKGVYDTVSPTLGEKSFLWDTTELEEIIHMELGN